MKSNIQLLAQNLEGKSLLILGGTGLFAKTLLPKLTYYIDFLNVNTKIYLTTRDKKKAIQFIPEINKFYIKLINIDFLYEDKIKEKIKPNFIIHMATTSAFETYNQISQFSKFLVLQNSTRAVGKIIKENNVEKLLFVSSGVAYGDVASYEENVNTNIDLLESKNSLAMGKIYSEFFLNSICTMHNTELKIARCFSFISEYLPCNVHYAIGNFVRDATFDKEIIINSDGKDLRSFQDVSDTVEWLTFILNEQLPHKIINVGSDKPISILNLAKKIKKILNANSQIIVKNNSKQIDNSRRNNYIPSLKIAYQLGLKQNISLDESIINLSNNLKKINEN